MAGTLGENEQMKYVTIINGEQFEIHIQNDGSVLVNGEPRDVDFLHLSETLYSMITNNRSVEVALEEKQGKYSILMEGRLFEGQVLDERALLMAARRGGLGTNSGEVHSPMPGLIVAVPIEAGAEVKKGATVIILESMKMQNELKSPIDGVVQTVHVKPGQTVEKDTLLVSISPPAQ